MKTADILQRVHDGDPRSIGRAISLIEDQGPAAEHILQGLDRERINASLILGMTGPPGAGKSTLTGRLIEQLRSLNERVGIVAVDPSSPVSGGALLGDRIRMMQHATDRDVVVRSMATRGRLGGLCASAGAAVRIMAASGCATVIIETVGVGQSEMDIIGLADITAMILAPGFGDDIQAMKAGILEVADLIVINKSDQPGTEKMMLDLGTVFSCREDRDNCLLKTVATENRGLEKLVHQIRVMEKKFRRDGTIAERRRQSFTLETLDWAIAMLRPRLARLAESQKKGPDPRLTAEEIIRQLVGDMS
jgi:LAO/AO transport system kinase